MWYCLSFIKTFVRWHCDTVLLIIKYLISLDHLEIDWNASCTISLSLSRTRTLALSLSFFPSTDVIKVLKLNLNCIFFSFVAFCELSNQSQFVPPPMYSMLIGTNRCHWHVTMLLLLLLFLLLWSQPLVEVIENFDFDWFHWSVKSKVVIFFFVSLINVSMLVYTETASSNHETIFMIDLERETRKRNYGQWMCIWIHNKQTNLKMHSTTTVHSASIWSVGWFENVQLVHRMFTKVNFSLIAQMWNLA